MRADIIIRILSLSWRCGDFAAIQLKIHQTDWMLDFFHFSCFTSQGPFNYKFIIAYNCIWSYYVWSLTTVWKHEWRWTRKGGFPDRASTLFSTMVHSTSSSWMIMSFLRILIAYNSSEPFLSANITWVISLLDVRQHTTWYSVTSNLPPSRMSLSPGPW